MVEGITVLFFLLWINFMPPLANLILKESFDFPLDGGRLWIDNHPLFGPHKTIRGVLASVLGGILFVPLLGVEWWIVCYAVLLAMSGDLLSSFIKRRLRYKSGKSIFVLDQLFEGLFPVLFLAGHLALGWWPIVVILLLFIPITNWGAKFWQYVLYHPPTKNYPRIIRSTVRLKEWRACHQPLARWHTWFNFPNFIYHRMLMAWFFRATGLYQQGINNSLNISLEHVSFSFRLLPKSFDGFRILLLTDLHLDGLDELEEIIIDKVKDLEVDLCLVGGDIRMEVYGAIAPAMRRLRRLFSHIQSTHGICGVLGNHDCIEMVPDFEEAGMLMLVNDSQKIESNNEKIWLVGLDDPHYYKVDDLDIALKDVPEDGFKICLAHSPEAYRKASGKNLQFYLCGHTHGGQICLPGRGPLYTNSRAPRFTASGRWEYLGMTGYTSRGVGASGIPLRFNCSGEISLITLRSST